MECQKEALYYLKKATIYLLIIVPIVFHFLFGLNFKYCLASAASNLLVGLGE